MNMHWIVRNKLLETIKNDLKVVKTVTYNITDINIKTLPIGIILEPKNTDNKYKNCKIK